MPPRERATQGGGRGKAKAAAYAYIPADIYEEILYRLSCTQLSKLRFVCKDWLRLLSSPEFIEKHQERSKGSASGTRILTSSGSGKIQLYRYAEGEGNINVIGKGKSLIPIPNPNPNNRDYLRILGSCDGLVLCNVGYNKIALMNPCTGTTDTRDDIDLPATSQTICSWFGRHPSTREYVLVLGILEHDIKRGKGYCLVFKVYSLSGNTINTIFIENIYEYSYKFTSLQCTGTLLHGRLHFPMIISHSFHGINYHYILWLDFERNTVFSKRGPLQSSRDFTLGVVEGCLSATMGREWNFEMWIMKGEHWSKYANIKGYNYPCRILTPIAYFPNGDVIFEGDDLKYTGGANKIVSLYNFRDMEIKQYCEGYATFKGKCGAIACTESLLTPAMIWRGGGNQDYIHTFTRQLGFHNVDQ